ncbi:MAG: bifunctional phosphoribosylaminoimidazolecarboxamide formyltransferase/IMP cyclohydrolase [Bacteroidales bacterium]|jgi:phosphoribosylaminoimidazolecarboxamide formyltransferase/IMP cyclohydrolase|nr:bifunctional phosphoribosylaminoimidazolecarboxamide formyltransferase/IMP cyclohydrolase [Bacteroidales bacterium]
MSNLKQIKSALISVFDKTNLEPIIEKLNNLGIQIYSTGGTKQFIEKFGVNVFAVEDLTDYPSILGGRVKTLHPKVFGGILARRDNVSDKEQLGQYQIPEIDLVIVDLYPFEDTVASVAAEQDIIEKIDIGGISLIRATAKNFKDTLIVSSKNQYSDLLEILEANEGKTSIEERKSFALEAFNVSSHYDTAIFNYFNNEKQSQVFKQSVISGTELRYGENPHQKGVFFGKIADVFDQLHGKQISYNNLLDIEAAVQLIAEFNETTFAVLKHNNACGIASRGKLVDAWNDALAGDPVSAFGGILISNKEVDLKSAIEIDKIFYEVIIAPSYNYDALELLKKKKNRIILIQKMFEFPDKQYRSMLNGALVQDRDLKMEVVADLKTATNKTPSKEEIEDLLFANKLVKHSKSNTIVLAKNKQLCASGVGQTSRVDALKQAITKANNFRFNLKGAIMASDAFFPFADSVQIASEAGIASVIQPGGSVKDQESIDYCNKSGMTMVFTGTRHFKH